MSKYNLALIGYGYWGPKLARNIQNSNKFKISYIIDNSRKNLDLAKKDFCQVSFPSSDLLGKAKISKSGYFFNKYVKQSIAHLFLPAIQIVLFFPCIFIFWR